MSGHEGHFHNKAAFLDDKERMKGFRAHELIQALPNFSPNDSFLDLGAGTGFFTIPLAGETKGKIFALDSDSKMLERIGEKMIAAGLSNVERIQADVADIPLEDGSVRHVVASLILHEVADLEAVLAELFRVTEAGGDVAVIEYEEEKTPDGGPPHHIRLSAEKLTSALEKAGFGDCHTQMIDEKIYLLVASKTS
ncbi:class I SAM-dependent methyltransferase [Listeria kieliensis]